MYIVPLRPTPNQSFRCVIPINGVSTPLLFSLSYNTEAQYWILRLSDDAGNILVDSLPLYAGIYPAANILQQYHHLQIGSAVVVPIGNIPEDQQPDDTNLGVQYALVWGDNLNE